MREHCCEAMRQKLDYKCEQHPNPYDCPDNLIVYNARFDEYGIIIHDGGSSYVLIHYCPWCGTKLPNSKRDLWFETLEELGYDNPFEQEIPSEFITDEWYAKRS